MSMPSPSQMGVNSFCWSASLVQVATKSICVSVELRFCNLAPFCFAGALLGTVAMGVRLPSLSSCDRFGTNCICVKVCWRLLRRMEAGSSSRCSKDRCLFRGFGAELGDLRFVVRTVQGIVVLTMTDLTPEVNV